MIPEYFGVVSEAVPAGVRDGFTPVEGSKGVFGEQVI
jgi:hypothetical protein